MATTLSQLSDALDALDPSAGNYAIRFVDTLLTAAREMFASDIHLQPVESGIVLRLRLDGVLTTVGTYSSGEAAVVVNRLKVLSELLTYRTDIPQEGRIRETAHGNAEMRVSTFPTVFGERAVVRIFTSADELLYLDQLGMPADTVGELAGMLGETTGAILITGPAGSGKTTTAYACLRHVARETSGGRSIVSLEDPVEIVLPSVAQAQVNETAGLELHSGLKSLLRQDPEVLFVGEIRDRIAAEVAIQAALTGQLLISTFHAGTAAEAVSRLIDIGIEPYLLRSSLLGILSQRLVRRLCKCAADHTSGEELLGLPVQCGKTATGCPRCRGTGYDGRVVLTELIATRRRAIGKAILSRDDADVLEGLAVAEGMTTMCDRGLAAVEAGITSPAEIRRVFGLRTPTEES